jgi:hypothetical protein
MISTTTRAGIYRDEPATLQILRCNHCYTSLDTHFATQLDIDIFLANHTTCELLHKLIDIQTANMLQRALDVKRAQRNNALSNS